MRKILLIRLVGYGIDGSNRRALTDPEYVRATAVGATSGNVPVEITHQLRDPVQQLVVGSTHGASGKKSGMASFGDRL
ncbi:hypothetical protein [Streptomyces sp. NPDC006691]|uniref:hypothetical protein n=1 Tax=Streptomyces sp. NPDC006691 TaxID=3364757 RepID=UPI003677F50F